MGVITKPWRVDRACKEREDFKVYRGIKRIREIKKEILRLRSERDKIKEALGKVF